ncbi:DUF4270 family protein [Chryseobacterium jejuense]|uniref:DUF4270 domain-containing protein n=1 Tax=Chryseobacterium jejuense TaxID=445960 RepID=A0A2X2WUX6_CHRJE|nr:DUF4270 family protein [Chryseobacterium jejuense]SDJ64206.1 protein of unknown function [Chryseobacterium jejuense]SQB43337.1 Uncharacterised protein [Chryseobacterium jejuense]
MTHTLKRTFAMLLLAVFGSAILYNCEPDPDSLGQQLFDKDAATGAEKAYDVIAYNINNNDSIKSDWGQLVSTSGTRVAVLGAFKEGQFGMQKASYITQLRLPDGYQIGEKPVVDSVVLVVRTPANTADDTYYMADKVVAPGAYDKNDFMIDGEKVAVSLEKKTYPVRKYGNAETIKSMKINVHRVNEFLDSGKPEFTYSNKNVTVGDLLGSATFDGNVSTITATRKSDNTVVFDGKLGFRMNLDKDYFQQNILNKRGDNVLKDAANFTRYFNGIKLSVEGDDGYLFQFSPDDMELRLYYKADKTENATVTRPQQVLAFDLGNRNTRLGRYEYDRSGSEFDKAIKYNNVTGDGLLFSQGMGGSYVGLKIDKATIENLKEKFNTNKAGIVGAKIRIFIDKDKTFANPQSVVADRKFILLPNEISNKDIKPAFTPDMLKGFPTYYYGKTTIKNEEAKGEFEFYDFVVTQTLKDIVENSSVAAADKILYLYVGAFMKGQNGNPIGANYTTRGTDMNRIVLIGSDKTEKRVQLKVTYSTANNK